MAEHDSQLGVAGTASSGAEADLMCQRLAEAGITATAQRAIGGPEWGASGPTDKRSVWDRMLGRAGRRSS